MPYVPDFYRGCVGFIYGSARKAKADSGFLAMGFVVSVPGTLRPLNRSLYFVTCNHVLDVFRRDVVVRFNTRTGCDSLSFAKNSFIRKKLLDIAVAPFKLPSGFPIVHIGTETFIKSADLYDRSIGAGDDVFMVSRVVLETVRYKQRNIAMLRFGNIALVPQAEEDFYLVEMRSIAGHSGSPVFVYSVPSVLGSRRKDELDFAPMFLGINRGHLRDYEQIVDLRSKKAHPRLVAETNLAMSQVVPAWYIDSVLNENALKSRRLECETLGPLPEIIED